MSYQRKPSQKTNLPKSAKRTNNVRLADYSRNTRRRQFSSTYESREPRESRRRPRTPYESPSSRKRQDFQRDGRQRSYSSRLNTQKKSNKSNKELLNVIIIAVVVVIFAVALKFSTSTHNSESSTETQNQATATQTEQDKKEETTSEIPEFARQNFETLSGFIVALGDSIPETDELKEINGASVSSEQMDNINAALDIFEGQNYHIGFVLLDLDSGKGIIYNTKEVFYSASAIKAPYIAAQATLGTLNKDMEVNPAIRTEVEQVLVDSDNDSYYKLYKRYGAKNFNDWCIQAGTNIKITNNNQYAHLTSLDLAKMWLEMYINYDEGAFDEDLLQFASEPTRSSIHETLSDEAQTFSKAGWYPTLKNYTATNDAGIVKGKDSTYLLSICSNAPVKFDLVDEVVDALATAETSLTL